MDESVETCRAGVRKACHSLGQPVTVIATCLRILRNKAVEPETQAMLDRCIESCGRIIAIVNELGDANREQ